MKEFEYYLKKGDVLKRQPDKRLAKALAEESSQRLTHAKSLKLSDANAKYILEHAYEAAREIADAVLYTQGFKSYSHEATISYFQGKLSAREIDIFDRLRKKRNGIKYYGENVTTEEAKDALVFVELAINKILAGR
jgi:uncharacterized protein (UPF0332 family)